MPIRAGVVSWSKNPPISGIGEADTMFSQMPLLWPLLLFFLLIIVLVAGVIGFSYVLGQRHHDRAAGLPYESGMLPTTSARLRFSAELYLIAMFFVIFDVESVLLFPWAVDVRELGWTGYAEAAFFTLLLLAALAYLWRSGALNLASPARRRSPIAQQETKP